MVSDSEDYGGETEIAISARMFVEGVGMRSDVSRDAKGSRKSISQEEKGGASKAFRAVMDEATKLA